MALFPSRHVQIHLCILCWYPLLHFWVLSYTWCKADGAGGAGGTAFLYQHICHFALSAGKGQKHRKGGSSNNKSKMEVWPFAMPSCARLVKTICALSSLHIISGEIAMLLLCHCFPMRRVVPPNKAQALKVKIISTLTSVGTDLSKCN